MQHECRIAVLERKCFTDYQENYLVDPKSGPCPFFKIERIDIPENDEEREWLSRHSFANSAEDAYTG